ncbi:MAG TPA: PilT/PilU family type 4a pilus ATPase [Chthoniobacteraceae bacterium]|jgi:twitching motility protein PilT|nr:PilT/PilU family type 4a pilus ATPase [Chthoniobacteraceae bacterium]
MRRSDFDRILTSMMEAHPGVSDLLFTVGRPFQVESYGELKQVDIHPDVQRLTPQQTETLALNIIGEDRRLIKELIMMGSCDCSYALNDRFRFRVNVFKQRGNFAIVMRKPQPEVPSLTGLGLPPIFQDVAREKNGLVLVTGATGSGKTTTLAAILNEINDSQAVHVVTLEDPIEFVHRHKNSTFSQRELGSDFDDYPSGLRAALRQAPKVILLGEMRDRDTVEIALAAAETGHLVLSTIHTIDAGQTINRITGLFDQNEEKQLRLRLADTLRYVISQRLAPKRGGGRLLLTEVMGTNLRVRETIAFGENENRNFYDIIESNATFGWHTFDQSIARGYDAELITEDTANLYATRKGKVTRSLDNSKKRRGIATDTASTLRLDEMPPPGPGVVASSFNLDH